MPTFYFDPTAGGAGTGTQVDPFYRHSHLRGMPLADNTTLLFKRGTTWRPGPVGQSGVTSDWLLAADFWKYSNCTVDAYGTGEKPIIDGSIDLAAWVSVGGGVYSKYMANTTQTWGYTAPGNLTIGSIVPYYVRWRGSLSASLAVAGSAAYVQTFDYNTDTWYLKAPSAPSVVQASYWRSFTVSSDQLPVAYNSSCKNIKVQRFSAYPFQAFGQNTFLLDGYEAWAIGGMYRKSESFWEGNAFDFGGGSDNSTMQNCKIEDVFDAGMSLQFATSWGGAWGSLSNVTIKNNQFYRCGLAGIEFSLQGPTDGDTINGVYIEGNLFDSCGKGQFKDTENGGHVGIVVQQPASDDSVSSWTTNVYVRYNRFNNCQAFGGNPCSPAEYFIYGNICTMDGASKESGDFAIQTVRAFTGTHGGTHKVNCYGNVIVGYDRGIGMSDWAGNQLTEFVARYNTIINCGVAFPGSDRYNVTFRIANNTIYNCSTGASGWGNSTFQSQGGNYLSAVTTNGFTPNGSDAISQSAPQFASSTYMPVDGSGLYSGGVSGLAAYGDPNRVGFANYPTSRNAYAVYAGTPVPTTPKLLFFGDSLTAGSAFADGVNEATFVSYRGKVLADLAAAGLSFTVVGPNINPVRPSAIPAAASLSTATLQTDVNTGTAHEMLMDGVPPDWDWGTYCRAGINGPNPPNFVGWTSPAWVPWGHCATERNNPPGPHNWRIAIYAIRHYERRNGTWQSSGTQVTSHTQFYGGIYLDYATNTVANTLDLRTSNGYAEVKLPDEGGVYHFFPTFRTPMTGGAEHRVVMIKCALTLDNPAGIDDRAAARVVMVAGGDWYKTMVVAPGAGNNYDFWIGRARKPLLSANHSWHCAHTMTAPSDISEFYDWVVGQGI